VSGRLVVRLDSRYRLPRALGPAVEEAVREAFTHDNTAYVSGRDDPRDAVIRTYGEEDGALSVPRGGARELLRIFAEHGLEYELEDARTWCHPEPDFPDHKLAASMAPGSEWAHQGRCIDAMQRYETGLVEAGTGSGKTSAFLALCARLKRRAMVMVWSGPLQEQWAERAVAELGMRPEEIGIIGDGREEVGRHLTIAMQQTLARDGRARKLAKAWDVFGLDEVQRTPADTVYAAADPIRARVRIGLSADHTRRDGLEFVTEDLFGDVIATVTREETIASGTTVPVDVRVVPTRFVAPWYRYQADKPGSFHRLLAQMVTDEGRNNVILRLARSAVVQSGEQVVVFTHRVEHARQLDRAITQMSIPSGVMVGGNDEAFEVAKEGFRSGKLRAVVGTYASLGTGIDFPAVARGIAATPIGNNKQSVGQVMGRLCRSNKGTGKERGSLAYLLDRSIYRDKPVRNFAQWGHATSVWDGRAWVPSGEWLAR
jgi:superfamily II DNA or RNA helicase